MRSGNLLTSLNNELGCLRRKARLDQVVLQLAGVNVLTVLNVVLGLDLVDNVALLLELGHESVGLQQLGTVLGVHPDLTAQEVRTLHCH